MNTNPYRYVDVVDMRKKTIIHRFDMDGFDYDRCIKYAQSVKATLPKHQRTDVVESPTPLKIGWMPE